MNITLKNVTIDRLCTSNTIDLNALHVKLRDNMFLFLIGTRLFCSTGRKFLVTFLSSVNASQLFGSKVDQICKGRQTEFT